ncbi:MAG: hypothetical protein P1V97_01120, partial [Planctomycetota bacterium]|nr:hypothetical protein [Planctomycetota bacterium]
MGRSKKRKKTQDTSLASLSKAARRQGNRMHAGYGDAFDSRKRKKPKAEKLEEPESQEPKHIAKVEKLVGRAREQAKKARTARALGFLVDALSIIDAPSESLSSELPKLLNWAPQHSLTNNQVKALVKGQGWREIPIIRIVTAYVLALSGRSHIVTQFVESRSDWTKDEEALVAALGGKGEVEDPFEVLPWGALARVFATDQEQELDRQFTTALVNCRSSRLGLTGEERSAFLASLAKHALQSPLWIRLPALIWLHGEFEDDHKLLGFLEETINEQFAVLANIDPQDAISIIFLCNVTPDSHWHPALIRCKALCWDAAGYGFGAIPAYLQLADLIANDNDDLKLKYLRRAREIAGTVNDWDSEKGILEKIVATGAATDDENVRLRTGKPNNQAAQGQSLDQRVQKLEARVKEYDAVTEKVALAAALLERSKNRKSMGDLLKALNHTADALEQDASDVTIYNLIEKNFDLSDSGTSSAHKRFLAALEASAETNAWAASIRAAVAKQRDRDGDEAKKWLQKGLEHCETLEQYQGLFKSAHQCGHTPIAEEALVQVNSNLEGEPQAQAQLAYLSWKIRSDYEFQGEDDPLFKNVSDTLGAKAYEGLGAAYLDRLGPSGSRSARAMFDKAHELDPENERLALDYLLASARPATPVEDYQAIATKLTASFPEIGRIAVLMKQTVYESNHLEQSEREQMALNVRRELMSQHFRIYTAMSRQESVVKEPETDENAEIEASET